jgi:hypothetical protein
MKEFDKWIESGYYKYDPIEGKVVSIFGWILGFTANSHRGGQYLINSRQGRMQTTMGRLAWRLYYGEWPDKRLQYKDGNSFNIKICNLYIANRELPAVGKFSTLLKGISNESKRT